MSSEPDPSYQPPLVVVLSGPSGAGKDTVLRAALDRDARLASIVTAKTRAPRRGEEHGVHHLFLSDAEFDALLAADGFLEHADVYGHRSGVPRDQVRHLIEQGCTVIIRTDIQGARTLRQKVPGAVLVFITVPDLPTLETRLRTRNTDAESDLQRRLAAAADEMAASSEFDHVLVNHEGREVDAVDALLAVVETERSKQDRVVPVV
ncbi:MAG TPA: guanylate kinase [Dehalococcoidia bacterium]|nr:guanylate kinase [Dehalococcoidia bacterium]